MPVRLLTRAHTAAGTKPHAEKLAQVHRLLKEGITSLNADDKCAPGFPLAQLWLISNTCTVPCLCRRFVKA